MNVLIVEADGIFQGHRRVRVPKGTSLDDLHRALHEQLSLDLATAVKQCTNNDGTVFLVSVYDSTTHAIVPLERADQLHTHARIFLRAHPSLSLQQQQRPVLAIATRSFGFAFDQGEFKVHGVPLIVGEVGNTGQGTGLTIWDGSVVLAQYLEHTSAVDAHQDSVRGKRVLELGAGTGLVGLAAALCGAADVTITDLGYTLPNIDANIAANAAAIAPGVVVRTLELDWFKESVGLDVDVLVGSDIVWVEPLIPPLVRTIAAFLHDDRRRTMLLSHQTRSMASDTLFFSLLTEHGVAWTEIDSALSTDKIHLFRLHREGSVSRRTAAS
ncbi:Aste57867_12455 [Aphanomyces stellatus]|uniref:Aste57867_12455 protein n=1 Tax=Aphanomyces stellatus TaxID=120398 RepID=A0A485KVL5_9STRA|nr:hypothetical protein As57867_012409 [Aphanomyces stellatus]VFT89306.1 Aste57867_12455 [Aphanomyces stellatus]